MRLDVTTGPVRSFPGRWDVKRSPLLTSTARTIRPSVARGNGKQPSQAARFQSAAIDRVVHRPVPAPVLDQRHHRAVRAQHRVGELEERVRTGTETQEELDPEPCQHAQRLDVGEDWKDSESNVPRIGWPTDG